MSSLTTRFAAAAAMAGAAALTIPAHAVTSIDFEGVALTGLYFGGDSFAQNGYTMTVDFDAGIVDGTGAWLSGAPTGNSTQFYGQLNEGGLIVQRSDGALFNMYSFDSAFVPLSPPASGTTVIVAVGVNPDNTTFGYFWSFSRAFSTMDSTGLFTQVKLVEFFACPFDGANVCNAPLRNNGQFAIDNIMVEVPEPTTTAMLTLGVLGLALRARRAAR